MPYNDPDITDPMTFHATEVETDDPNSIRDMAECFIEEYVRLGLSRERILDLFRDGRFAGPALAIRRLGEPAVAAMIREQFELRGARASRRRVEQTPSGNIELPVIEL